MKTHGTWPALADLATALTKAPRMKTGKSTLSTLTFTLVFTAMLASCGGGSSGGAPDNGAEEGSTENEPGKSGIAPSGSLDPDFGTNGIVVNNNAAGKRPDNKGYAIAIDASGRILVTGYGHSDDMVIWRYNTDGTLDTSFGTDGMAVHDNAAGGEGYDEGHAVTVDSSGKILVTGYSENANGITDMVIWRYNDNGSPDARFGNVGVVVHDSAAGGSYHDRGYDIAIDSKGRILVTGISYSNAENYDMVIWRYNPDGTLDTTFGNDGIVINDNAAGGNGNDTGNSIHIDSKGRILIAGSSQNDYGNRGMVIWRYNPDGTLDTSFNSSGMVVYDNNTVTGTGNNSGYSITTDNLGRILVAGTSSSAYGATDMALWRYNPDGSPDTTFGTNGVVIHADAAGGGSVPSASHDGGRAVTTDSSGKILVAGYSTGPNDRDMAIWRYNDNGTLDESFGTNGFVIHNNAAGGNGRDSGRGIAIDSSGRILVAGSSAAGGDYDMVIWRYMP